MCRIKCRSCGKECDEDSVICPNCGADPKKEEQIKRSPEQFNLLWEGLRNRIILGAVFWGVILFLIFGITLIWVYRAASDSTQRFIEKEVEQQFKEPDIKDVINSAAVAKAEQYMSEAITPEVEKARQEIHSALERTTKLMQETQEQLDQIRRIIELEDAARSG